MSGQADLTKGSVYVTLFRFSLPFLLANILQAMYGAVDLFIVGHFADSAAVSAVATGSQVMQTVTGFSIGLTTGGTVVIGQLFGAGRKNDLSGAAATIFTVFLLFAIGLSAFMHCTTDAMCAAMCVPNEALAGTRQYLQICSGGILFIVGFNAVSAILRGLGDSATPLVFVAAACAANIVGDFLLVSVLHLGAAGAAAATVIAQAASLGFAGLYLFRRGHVARFRRGRPRIFLCTAKNILSVGVPVALQDGLINISFLMITAIINTLGLAASAAVGVVEKLIVFAMLPTTAFSSAIAAMAAQNEGAGLPRRAMKCLKGGIGFSLLFGLACFLATQWDSGFLIRLFTSDSAVIAAGAPYLKAYGADCVLVCFVFCINAYCSGTGHPVFPLVHSLIATFLVRVPLSILLVHQANASMYAIGCAAPAASFLSLAMCGFFLRIIQRKKTRYQIR